MRGRRSSRLSLFGENANVAVSLVPVLRSIALRRAWAPIISTNLYLEGVLCKLVKFETQL